MEDAMAETLDSSESETSFLPLLLLVAVLAAAYWIWSSSSGSSVSQPATAVPDAEELRRRRLEALAKAAPSEPMKEVDGLRKRVVKEEEAKEVKEAKVKVEAEPKSAEPKSESKAPEAPKAPKAPKAPEPKVEGPKPMQVKPESNDKPNEPKANDLQILQSPRPSPQTAPEEVPKVVPATLASLASLALRARATIKGTSHVRNVEVQADTSVQQLQSEVLKAFPEAADSKARIFFNGKELKSPTDRLDSLGFSNNICLQVMFVSFRAPPEEQPKVEVKQEEVKAEKEKDAQGELPAPQEEALNVRIQSTVKGSTSAFVIKELTTCSRVLDLEALSLGAFAPGDNLRPRLFFMGRELKDGDAFLGHVGLNNKATATVQVMFAAGEPRIPGKAPISEAPAPVATASAAAGGNPSPVVQEGTNEAVLAAAAAAGCNVSVLLGGQAEPAAGGSPAEAWRAMAGLEEQLSRETDMSEEASVRQASMMLRQLLTTATHDSNPGLMEFAQSAVPDLKMIWSFEPTREHLKGLLAMKQSQNQA